MDEEQMAVDRLPLTRRVLAALPLFENARTDAGREVALRSSGLGPAGMAALERFRENLSESPEPPPLTNEAAWKCWLDRIFRGLRLSPLDHRLVTRRLARDCLRWEAMMEKMLESGWPPGTDDAPEAGAFDRSNDEAAPQEEVASGNGRHSESPPDRRAERPLRQAIAEELARRGWEAGAIPYGGIHELATALDVRPARITGTLLHMRPAGAAPKAIRRPKGAEAVASIQPPATVDALARVVVLRVAEVGLASFSDPALQEALRALCAAVVEAAKERDNGSG